MHTAVGFPTAVKNDGGLSAFAFNTPAVCFSACVFVFAAGRYRYYDPDADHSDGRRPEWVQNYSAQALGVHQFFYSNREIATAGRFGDGLAAAQQLVSVELNYLAKMGVSAELVEIAGRVGPQDIKTLSSNEAYQLQLANDPPLDPIWKLTERAGGLQLSAQGENNHARFVANIFCSRRAPSGLYLELQQQITSAAVSSKIDKSLLEDLSLSKQIYGPESGPYWMVLGSKHVTNIAIPSRKSSVVNGFFVTVLPLDATFANAADAGERLFFADQLSHSTSAWLPSFELKLPGFKQKTGILLRNCI